MEVYELEKLRNIHQMDIKDIRIDPADLQSYMSFGTVISGSNLDLLKIKTVLEDLESEGQIRIIYMTITNKHLKIVPMSKEEKESGRTP